MLINRRLAEIFKLFNRSTGNELTMNFKSQTQKSQIQSQLISSHDFRFEGL